MNKIWSYKLLSVLVMVALASAFINVVPAAAAGQTFTSNASGNWNDPATWNTVGIRTFPSNTEADTVIISSGNTVTLTGATVINGVLTINSGGTLNTNNNDLTFASNFSNNGTLIAGSSNIVITAGVSQDIAGFSTTGSVTINKNGGTATLTSNVSAAALVINGSSSTLNLGSGLSHSFTSWTCTAGTLNGGSSTVTFSGSVAGTSCSFIAGTSTVLYNASAVQTLAGVTYYNLTLGGTSAKTTTGAAVNGILSMEGTASINGTAPTFGPAATLQYNTATDRTAGTEWRDPFAGSGGIIIGNTGKITLAAGKTLSTGVSLTINSGSTLLIGNNALTVGGNFINNGTFTAGSTTFTLQGDLVNGGTLTLGSSRVVLTGASDQSIASFSTTGVVSMTKTSHTATFQGDVSGGGLTISGAGGTLDLGAAHTHSFSGPWIMTAGTLNGSSSTLNLSGNFTAGAATFNQGTSTVNFNGASQTIGGMTYYNLQTSGGGVKSLLHDLVVDNNLVVGASTNLTIPNYSITVTGITTVNGTLTHNNNTGTKIYNGAMTVNGSFINTMDVPITFHGGLTFNGTTFTSSAGQLTFSTNDQQIGGTKAFTIRNMTVTGVTLSNYANLTVTDLGGTGTFIQMPDAGLTLGGTLSIAILNATASPNMVSYNRSGTTPDQIIRSQTYHHLSIAGSGNKTLEGPVTVNGDLTIGSGPTLIVPGYAFTVTGSTTVGGTLTFTGIAGDKTFNGPVSISGTWDNSANSPITFHGGLTNNGSAFTAGDGIYNFSNNDQEIGGSKTTTIPYMFVTGVKLTNTANLVVSTSLAGTGQLEQAGASSYLTISGTITITTLTASASGNTVEYNGTDQTVKPTVYYHLKLSNSGDKDITGVTTINGNFTLARTASSGITNANAVNSMSIGGDFSLGNYTAFTVNEFNFTVNGNTSLSGSATLTHTSAAASIAYNGNVVIGANSKWFDNNEAIAITFGGNFQNDGANNSLYAGAGVHTFIGTGKSFSGIISIPNITITGSYTNNGTLTATTSMDGAGSLTQGVPNPVLHITSNFTLANLTATSNPNTVFYDKSGSQTIRAITYHNLTTGGISTKSLAGNITINGSLTIGAGTTLDVAGANYSINLGGSWTNNGTFLQQAGTVTFQGTAAQTITGVTTFNDAILNNNAGLSLASSITVNHNLTLTSGKITTGGRSVTIGTAGAINGANASRYVYGTLQKNFLSGPQAFVYDIGDGTTYTPVSVAFANVSTGGYLSLRTTAGEHPSIATSGLDFNHDVNRYWNLSIGGGLVYTTYDVTFTWADADKDAGVNTSLFLVKRNITSTSWSAPTTVSPLANSIQATGLSAVGGFAVGQPDVTAPTVVGVDTTLTDAAYTTGTVVPIKVTFSELVVVTGTPQLTLQTAGLVNEVVNYTTGSGTNTLTFNYTVVAGDTSAHLDYLSTGALVLNTGTLRDYASLNATLALPTPGAAGSLSANSNILIDTTAPTTSISSHPPVLDSDTTPTFGFSGDDGTVGSGLASFMCYVDTNAAAVCASPFTTAALIEGHHTFYVYAVDKVGIADATPASFDWTIDLSMPDTSLTGQPANPSNDNTPTFSFTGSDPGGGSVTFRCWMDAASPATCTSPYTSAAIPDGSHTFHVAAVDGIGNQDPSAAIYTWTVDTTPPTTTLGSHPNTLDNDNTPTFSFSGNDGTGVGGLTFKCKIDGDAYAACSSPYTSVPLSDGSHTFYVYAQDGLGNADSSPATFTWTLDLTAPTTTLGTHPNDPDSDTTPTFTFSGSDAGGGSVSFMCKFDNNPYAACTSPKTLPTLMDGIHTFYVYAVDAAGNADPTPASYTWTLTTELRIFIPLIIHP